MGILTNRANYQDIDGVLWGWQWAANQTDNHTQLYYSFPTSTAAYGYAISDFEPFNAAQQAAAYWALANYDAVCNVDFVFTTDGASGNIRFAEANSFTIPGHTWNGAQPAYGLAPDNALVILAAQGDTWFNHTSYNTPMVGKLNYASGILHEIGHALGLKHSQDSQDVYDAGRNLLHTNPALPAAHDGLEFTVMSYRAYPGAQLNDLSLGAEGPSTLMQNDILALQWMYGANYGHNSGNTIYNWNSVTGQMSVNGVSNGGAAFHNKVLMTIWDDGGADTYDFSNFATPVTVDLRPGGWSTPSKAMLVDLDHRDDVTHLARGCIANALAFNNEYRGYIENAWGGSGNDVLSGNALHNQLRGNGGNDTLNGVSGNDTLIGGPGNDTYYINGGDAISEAANAGADTVRSSVTYALGANLEFLVLEGTAAINGTGNVLNNYLLGNGAANVLNGEAGTDTLAGGKGNDTYYVETGDTITEAANAGIDLVRSWDSRTLGANLENLVLMGTAPISGAGNALANVMVGNAAANLLSGGAAKDNLLALAGADWLIGGAGNDVLRGGSGNDNFAFTTPPSSSANRDTIGDFANTAGNNDTIYLENAVFSRLGGGAAHALNPAFFRVGAHAADANDFIVYNKATGALFYDANGSAAGGVIQFATLATKPLLTAHDFVVM